MSANGENPRDACWKIEQAIKSCTEPIHVIGCLSLISNFRLMHGEYNDGQYSIDRFYHDLSLKEREINKKERRQEIENMSLNLKDEPVVVQFLRDPQTKNVFACFPEFKLDKFQDYRLCYYDKEYFELKKDYLEKCQEPIFSEYRDLLLDLMKEHRLTLFAPSLNQN